MSCSFQVFKSLFCRTRVKSVNLIERVIRSPLLPVVPLLTVSSMVRQILTLVAGFTCRVFTLTLDVSYLSSVQISTCGAFRRESQCVAVQWRNDLATRLVAYMLYCLQQRKRDAVHNLGHTEQYLLQIFSQSST